MNESSENCYNCAPSWQTDPGPFRRTLCDRCAKQWSFNDAGAMTWAGQPDAPPPTAPPNDTLPPLEDRLRSLLAEMKDIGMALDVDANAAIQMLGSVLLQWHGYLSELLPEEKP